VDAAALCVACAWLILSTHWNNLSSMLPLLGTCHQQWLLPTGTHLMRCMSSLHSLLGAQWAADSSSHNGHQGSPGMPGTQGSAEGLPRQQQLQELPYTDVPSLCGEPKNKASISGYL